MLVLFEGDRRHAGVANLQHLTWLDLRAHSRSIITWMLQFRIAPNKQSLNFFSAGHYRSPASSLRLCYEWASSPRAQAGRFNVAVKSWQLKGRRREMVGRT